MNKEQRIEELLQQIERDKESINKCQRNIEALKNCKDIDKRGLYALLSTIDGDIDNDELSVRFYNGKYKHILGGDGRSQPWDETKNGKICEIVLNYPLFDCRMNNIVRNFMHEVFEVDYTYIHHLG